jgi:hypothetical protein
MDSSLAILASVKYWYLSLISIGVSIKEMFGVLFRAKKIASTK